MKVIKKFEEFYLNKLKDLSQKEKTYLEKIKRGESISDEREYKEILALLRSCDVNDFEFVFYDYGRVTVKPDSEFLKLIERLNSLIKNKIDLSHMVELNLTVDFSKLNQIDLEFKLDPVLQGLSISYKIYKKVIQNYEFITSDKNCTKLAYNIWWSLMLDPDFFCFTSKDLSGVISKNAKNETIKLLLEQIKKIDIEFDDFLTQKITEIYGSMELYKQRN